MKPIPILAAAILILTVAGCSPGVSAGSAAGNPTTGYTLRMRPKQGETFKFVMKIDMSEPIKQTSEVGVTQTITKVEAGKITTSQTIDSMTANGKAASAEQLKAMAAAATTAVTDDRGKIITMTGGNPTSNPMQNAQFPEKAVKPGDTWSSDGESNGMKTNAKYTFVGVETVAGKQAAHLKGAIEIAQSSPTTFPFDMWVELDNGIPLKSTLDMTMKAPAGTPAGQPGSMKMKMTMERK